MHTIVGQSILAGMAFEGALVKNGIHATSVKGAANLPYDIPHPAVAKCDRRSDGTALPLLPLKLKS